MSKEQEVKPKTADNIIDENLKFGWDIDQDICWPKKDRILTEAITDCMQAYANQETTALKKENEELREIAKDMVEFINCLDTWEVLKYNKEKAMANKLYEKLTKAGITV